MRTGIEDELNTHELTTIKQEFVSDIRYRKYKFSLFQFIF
jgi:hypothetical protein